MKYEYYKPTQMSDGTWSLRYDGFMDDCYISKNGEILEGCTDDCCFTTERKAKNFLNRLRNK